jgi:hypothetical protein
VDWTPSIDFAAPEEPGITYPQYPYRTHGTDFVDVDGDGRPEIAVAEGGPAASPDYVREPDRLFKLGLDPEPNWMLVHPVGDGENVSMDAINTRFALTVTDGSRTWTVHQTLLAASCFSAQNGFDVYFGLSGATSIVSLEVDWPDGTVETITDGVQVNERIEVSREDMRGTIGTRLGHVSDRVVGEVAALPRLAPDATAVKLASYPKGTALAFRCGLSGHSYTERIVCRRRRAHPALPSIHARARPRASPPPGSMGLADRRRARGRPAGRPVRLRPRS